MNGQDHIILYVVFHLPFVNQLTSISKNEKCEPALVHAKTGVPILLV